MNLDTVKCQKIVKQGSNDRFVFFEHLFNKDTLEKECIYGWKINILGLHFSFYSNQESIITCLKRFYSLFNESSIIDFTKGLSSQDIYVYLFFNFQRENHSAFMGQLVKKIQQIVIYKLSNRFLFFHGASVVFNRIGLIFFGHSGHGKTSISSFLKDIGGRVFSDDTVVLDSKDCQILPFPVFSSLRSRSLSNLQLKFKDFFYFFLKKYGYLHSAFLFSIPERDFQIYCNYQKKFYDLDNQFPRHKLKFNFIFLEKDVEKKPHLQNLTQIKEIKHYFDLMNPAVSKITDFFIAKLLCINEISQKAKFYSLKRGNIIKETIGLVTEELLL